MKRRIVLEKGRGRELARAFGCTPNTVCHAMHFRHDSELTRRIRQAALESGGVEVTLKSGKP